jgi:hypothetical protein
MKKYIYTLYLIVFIYNNTFCQYEINEFDGVYKLTIDINRPNKFDYSGCMIDIIDKKGVANIDIIETDPTNSGNYNLISGAGNVTANQVGLTFFAKGICRVLSFENETKIFDGELAFTMNGELKISDYVKTITGTITFKNNSSEKGTPTTHNFSAICNTKKTEEYDDKIVGGFSSISGQVEFCYPGDTDWQDAKMDTDLKPGTRIKTSMESTCLLHFHDLSTCRMGPESQVMVSSWKEDNSKLKLVLGKLWANIKKMTKDGKMEISTTQAVAGIKGTTLVLTDDGQHSTLKVIEGTVDFTSLSDGKKIDVNSGELVTGTETGLGIKESFDAAAETAVWDDLKANSVPTKMENKPIDIDNTSTESMNKEKTFFEKNGSLLIVVGAILLLFVSAFFSMRKKKK